MASYLQKLRRQSKQLIPQTEKKFVETKVGGASEAQDTPQTQAPATASATTTAGPSEPVQSTPAPAVTETSDETPAELEEDQMFAERLAALASEPEGEAPPLPTRPAQVTDDKGESRTGRDAQIALMDGADKVALPLSPPEVTAESNGKGKEKAQGGLDRKKSVLSYFSLDRFKKGDKEKENMPKDKTEKLSEKERSKMADDLLAAAAAAKVAEEEEQKKENKELTDILDQLNLSAVNNRVFSFSKESEELLTKFTQVLKDIINGAPTAYNDLEKLFTDYDAQLKKMYGGLPPFLQNMVKSLPAKLTATLGPELLAAGAEKPGFDAKTMGASSKSKKSKIPGLPTIPSLKSLVTAQGAVATALRSIVNFLKFRFPMLATGTNLIMSLAVFRKFTVPLLLEPVLGANVPQCCSSCSGTATSAAARHDSKKSVLQLIRAGRHKQAVLLRSTRMPTPSSARSQHASLLLRVNSQPSHSLSAITRRETTRPGLLLRICQA
jgi:hypothetical protein